MIHMEFLLRGNPIILTGALPGVSSATVQAISKVAHTLRELRLTELDTVSDDVFARLITGFPALESLALRSVS